MNKYTEAAEFLKSRIKSVTKTAVVLGTGMGDAADILGDKIEIGYGDIPSFPSVNDTWHKCRLIYGTVDGTPVIFMQGRLHYYEGFSMQEVVYPIKMLKTLGIENLILTNASGAINESFSPGDIIIIDDHIKLGLDSPLRGRNDETFGSRFFDMTTAYDERLKNTALSIAKEMGYDLKKGVYAYMTGPQFETPAEIKMLKIIGADLVGMSTVPEVIAAKHSSMHVLGLSGVTNMAAGLSGGGLNGGVIENAELVLSEKMKRLLPKIIKEIS